MIIDTIIQFISVLVAILVFGFTYLYAKKRDRHAANREIYQQLELASNELFCFEADHLKIIRHVWEKKAKLPSKETAEYIQVINYVCQMLNLFEIAIRFRKEKIVSPDIFSSWVIWYYTVCNAPHFPEIWDDICFDYIKDLREIMNMGVKLSLRKDLDEDQKREQFFHGVSSLLNCNVVKEWYTQVKKEN